MASDGAVAAAHFGKHAYVQWSVDEGGGDGRGSRMGMPIELCHLRFVVAAAERESFSARSGGVGRKIRTVRVAVGKCGGGEIELSDLRRAIAVSQHGSLRQAAQTVNIRQSTLSRRLRDIEYRLGACLFERTNGGTRPTTIGLEFLEIARRDGDFRICEREGLSKLEPDKNPTPAQRLIP